MPLKPIVEPFRIKSIEPIEITTKEERKQILEDAHYNLFKIPADKVYIDLLTDSGTGAMSAAQWAGIMRGDESYAGAKSFYHFENVIKKITGYTEVIPTHQGRAAERILFSFVAKPGKFIPANTHFDTTRANVEANGAIAIDLPIDEAWDFENKLPFKGNMHIAALEDFFRKKGRDNIPLVILTLTNNSLGGQPVSMENIRAVSKICRGYRVPLILDAARFAENAYFIKVREPGYRTLTPFDIAHEMFSYADGCMMSAKKDGLVNIGGFLALNDQQWANQAKEISILGEGFPTYGGLAGRDLEAMAQGLQEVLDEEYLKYRINSIAYLGNALKEHVPIIEPTGGHAVYVNAKKCLPHIPADQFPGQAFACALYLEAGVRSVEIGSLMFGKHDQHNNHFVPAPMELVRLAIPRRVYTQSHMNYLIDAIAEICRNKEDIQGLTIVEASPVLTHFTAKLKVRSAEWSAPIAS